MATAATQDAGTETAQTPAKGKAKGKRGSYDRFPKKMTCDLCGFEGSAQEVGSHVRVTHGKDLREQVTTLVKGAKRKGISRSELREATGWQNNRVARIVKSLVAEGKLREEGGKVFSMGRSQNGAQQNGDNGGAKRGPGRPRGSGKRTGRRPGRPRGSRNGTGTSITSDLPLDIVGIARQQNSRMVNRAITSATQKLIDEHKDEFTRLFTGALLSEQMGSLDESRMERLVAILVGK